MSNELDINMLLKYLPHRYPFVMLDRVLDVTPGESLTAIKNVTINEPFFTGHFPERPVMPGVLIIEALAQASGVLTFQTIGRMPEEGELFFLAGVNKTRFKRMVIPGDVLQLDAKLIKSGHGLWKFECEASVEGELACSAEIMNIRGTE